MNKLGFKNFRRFNDFPSLELRDVNILVGANNSGKSTFVKAAMLVMNFLKNAKAVKEGELPKFQFADIPHVNIDTFDRALSDTATERTITFSVDIHEDWDSRFDLFVHRDADRGDRSYGYVEKIVCTFMNEDIDEDKDIMFVITFDFQNKQTIFDESMDRMDTEPWVIPLHCKTDKTDNLILSLFDDLISYDDDDSKSEDMLVVDMQRSGLAQRLQWPIDYIYAHAASQAPLFDTRNLNDINAKVVEQFYKISGYQPVMKFVRQWLKTFEIGTRLSVECIEGTAYKVSIKDGARRTNLGDMGMGTIQIVILMMHIACLINATVGFQKNPRRNEAIIFIEEPEQNLHPALQSRLADFFLDIARTYGGRYIIETHSEYLVRRSQVLVAEDNRNKTPKSYAYNHSADHLDAMPHKAAGDVFSVYYFDVDGPRAMNYQRSGRFDQSFGPGFFDEAGKWNMRLIAIRKGE